MADTTQIKWVFPPNWDGGYDPGCGFYRMTVKFTGYSDATGETDAIKINRSELRTSTGTVPTKIIVESIKWNVHGLTAILEWDNSTDEVIAYMNGGVTAGSNSGNQSWPGGLHPIDTDGTGDIVLTTSNCAAGDTYDVTMRIRLKT